MPCIYYIEIDMDIAHTIKKSINFTYKAKVNVYYIDIVFRFIQVM